MKIYYFDNNSTTLIPKSVQKEIMKWLSCGNPSNSHHLLGRRAKHAIEKSRKEIADILKVDPSEIYFTGCATDSNNIAINSLAKINNKDHIITSAFEHKCVLEKCHDLEKKGYQVSYIYPDKHGIINPSDVEKEIKKNTCLITIMHGNNELGTVQDVKEIGRIAKKHHIPFHSDCVQTIGKFKLNPRDLNLTSMSFSGHKFHGPKGIGGLYMRGGTRFVPLEFGGGQEHNIRPGTENVAEIVGMTKALKLVQENREVKNQRVRDKCKYILRELKDAGINYKLLGDIKKRLPNTLLISFIYDKFCNKKLVDYLDENHICVSIGSACNTKSSKASHVLRSIKADKKIKQGTIRISLSDHNTMKECEYLIEKIIEGVNQQVS